MKKLTSCMLAIGMALTANAADYYLIGGFNGWTKADPNCKFAETTSGVYELDLNMELTSGFKINDGTWDEGAPNFGGSTALVLGEVYHLDTGSSSGDIPMAGAVKNPHLVFNPEEKTLVVSGQSTALVTTYALWTQFTGDWAQVDLTETNGKWSCTNVEVTKANAAFGIKELGNGAQTAWISAANSSDAIVVLDKAIDCKVEGTDFLIGKGTYNFTFDPTAMTLIVTGEAAGGGDEPADEVKYGIHGSIFGGDGWSTKDMTNNNGIWTLSKVTVSKGSFGIKVMDMDGVQLNGAPGWYSSTGNAEVVLGQAMPVGMEGTNFNINAGTYTFTFNPVAMTLTITDEGGETPDDPIVDPTDEVKYGIHGSIFGGEGWSTKDMTNNDGIWALSNVTVSEGSFGIKVMDMDGVQLEGASGWYSSTGDPDVVLDKALPVGSGGKNFNINAGTYTFTFNPSAMTLTVTGKSDPIVDPVAAELYLRGDFAEDWPALPEYKFSTTDNVIYTLNVAEMEAGVDFKIADASWSKYDFGGPADIELGSTVTLEKGSGSNMSLAVSANDLTFSFNINTLALTVNGTPTGDEPIVTPPTPSEETLYFRGARFGWGDVSEEQKFSTTDYKIYTYELDKLGADTEFKIANADWTVAYGNKQNVALGETVTLSTVGGNITMAVAATNLKFVFNIETAELTVTGTLDETPVDYTTWTVSAPGTYNEWGGREGYTAGVHPNVDGIAILNQQIPGDGEFKIKANNGDSDIYFSNGGEIALGEWTEIGTDVDNMILVNGDNNYYYTIKFNCKTKEIFVERSIATAVEAIEAAEGEAVYYNLQGVQVEKPANGMYVKVLNGKASKVLVK